MISMLSFNDEISKCRGAKHGAEVEPPRQPMLLQVNLHGVDFFQCSALTFYYEEVDHCSRDELSSILALNIHHP